MESSNQIGAVVYFDKFTLKVTGLDGTQSFDYTGKKEDPGTGLKYFGARFYDPEVGRFLTVDPKHDGNNWFVYCDDNPLKYIDPTGKVTVAFGGAASASFMISAGGSGVVVVDGHGNVGVVGSLSFGGGTPSAGLGFTLSITNADKTSNLSGLGVEGGLSASPVVGPSIGVDFIGGNGYVGVNINFGGRGTPIVFEGHGRINGAAVVNLNGWLSQWGKEAKDFVLDKLQECWDKLPEDVQDKIEDYLGMSYDDIVESLSSNSDSNNSSDSYEQYN